MTPAPEAFESDAFQRQISPAHRAAAVAWAFVLLGAAAVAFSTWLPLFVAYPLLLIFGLSGAGFRRKGSLRVDARGLWWRGSLAAPREAIVSVLREADALAVRTDSSWRPVQRFFFETKRDADALAVALGSPDERPAVPLRVGSPASSYGAGPFFAGVSAPTFWLLITLLVRSTMSAPAFVASVAASSLLLALLFAPTRLTLGVEGMEVRWLWRTRWIRWRDVASVEALEGSDAVVLHLRSGAAVRVPAEAAFALSDANAKIFARADDSRAHRGMGTTVVAAAYCPSDAVLYIAHAGDSRCYRIRDGRMEQLTRDHSLLQDALLERPDLTESDLAYLPRNVITRALGIGPSVELDVRVEPVRPGDCFLLCSDGLHGLVTDEDIVKIVVESPTLTEACQSLIQRANANGGKDNVTSVLIRIEDEDAPWADRRLTR